MARQGVVAAMGVRTIASRSPARLATQAILVAVLVGATAPATAGPASAASGHGAGSGSTGNDVSYPQCGGTLPGTPAFGIVGVNGGLAGTINPCFGPSASYPRYSQSELYWAVASATGGATQPRASLYVNTADPGNVSNGVPVGDWPASGASPYGPCTTTSVTTPTGTYTVGENSPACAWEYGFARATQDVSWLQAEATAIGAQAPPVAVPAAASAYPWWLDVETANTWQGGSTGLAMNVADLQGMVAALRQGGATAVGVYATGYQWGLITGTTTAASGSLYGLPDWIPGARSPSGAVANCGQSSFTGGAVVLTQWSGRVDGDVAC